MAHIKMHLVINLYLSLNFYMRRAVHVGGKPSILQLVLLEENCIGADVWESKPERLLLLYLVEFPILFVCVLGGGGLFRLMASIIVKGRPCPICNYILIFALQLKKIKKKELECTVRCLLPLCSQ